MTLAQLAPIAVFACTLIALLYLRYRSFASLSEEERRELLNEKSMRQHEAAGGRVKSLPEMINDSMPALVTVVILVVSVYIILSSGFEDDKSKWAYGSIAMILGYWLRPTVRSRKR